jgi:thiol-disulfide isomerase/thioredoxin
MMRFFAVTVLLVSASLIGCLHAGGGTSFKIGDPAPAFTNLPAVDGKSYSLGDFKQDLLVLCITCNHCPVAAAYEKRFIDFANKYAAGKDAKVAFVAVCVSTMDVDNLDKMKVRAKDSGFNFPYLYDPTQKLGKQLNAHVTPELYVFDKNRKLVYWGAMDDEMDVARVTEHYLVPAVDAALAGKSVPKALTKAFGCTVVYDKVGNDPPPPEVNLEVVKKQGYLDALAKLRGKVVIVDIWGEFCVPCKEAFPHVVELHDKYAAKGLACMSVSLDQAADKDLALKFLKREKAEFTNVLLDEPAKTWQTFFDVYGPPAVMVFDRDGKLAGRFDHNDVDKSYTHEDVEKLVVALLAR